MEEREGVNYLHGRDVYTLLLLDTWTSMLEDERDGSVASNKDKGPLEYYESSWLPDISEFMH